MSGTEKIEAELKAIREELRELKHQKYIRPMAVTISEAAITLGVGLTTTKNIIRKGSILTTMIGSRRMVLISEIDRYLSESTETPRPAKKPKPRWVPIKKP